MCQIIPLPYIADSTAVFAALRALPGAIWFDSGKPASNYGRYDIITAAPSALLETFTNEQRPFQRAQQLLDQLPELPTAAHSVPFAGGIAGYFSYDLGERLENVKSDSAAIVALPQMRLGLYHWSLVTDHHQQSTQLTLLDSCAAETIASVRYIIDSVHNKRDNNAAANNSFANNPFTLNNSFTASSSPAEYHRAIEAIHQYILAGDCYQVNFAQHFSAPYSGDSLAAYQHLRRAVPSPFSAYMEWQQQGRQQAILSLSPERLLAVSRDGHVESKPIKGTIRRGKDNISDLRNADQLLNSAKDRAENLMIVDLLRNDMGKSCQPGSIAVPHLFALESFANVHHLVSTITGKISANKSCLDLLQGCFPGGSITGAPKRRAMEIIKELESCQRSVYCGSIGYISRCGRMDSSIAIRTLVADNGEIHCWGGGGIVADSDSASEYRESLDKVQLLMSSLEQTD